MRSVLPSGYQAITKDDCIGSGECANNCQFEAIEMITMTDTDRARVGRNLKSDETLIQHRIHNLDKSGDIGSVDIVAGGTVLLRCLKGRLMDAFHDHF